MKEETVFIDPHQKLHDEFPDRLKKYEKKHPIKTKIWRKKKDKKKK